MAKDGGSDEDAVSYTPLDRLIASQVLVAKSGCRYGVILILAMAASATQLE